MASENRPKILLLSLSYREYIEEMYGSLFNSLTKSAILESAKTADDALRYLEANNPKVIIITDEGVTYQENAAVLDKVVSYVRNGGLAIVGLHFPSGAADDVFNNFFASAFDGLPWKRGDYYRTDFEFNPACVLPPGTIEEALPRGPLNMNVVHIKDARFDERIFIPVGGAIWQSIHEPSRPADRSQAAVAETQFGDGHLVYCGDVLGFGSEEIVLALCGITLLK